MSVNVTLIIAHCGEKSNRCWQMFIILLQNGEKRKGQRFEIRTSDQKWNED